MTATSDTDQPPLTEERVREIVREELSKSDAQSTNIEDMAFRISEFIGRKLKSYDANGAG